MKCSICGSENVTRSHRRGIEKIFRYILPRTPYRCKECWGRFWIFENPFHNTGVRILGGGLVCILLLFFTWSLFFGNKEKSWEEQIKNEVRPVVRKSPVPAETPSTPQKEADRENKSGNDTEKNAAATEKMERPPAAEEKGKETLIAEKTEPAVSAGENADIFPAAESAPLAETEGKKAGMPDTASGKSTGETAAPVSAENKTAASETVPPPKAEKKENPSPLPGTVGAADEKSSGELPQKSRSEKAGKPSADEKKPDRSDTGEVAEKIRELKKIETVSGKGTFGIHILTDGPVRKHTFFPLKSPPKLVVDLPGKWKHRGDALYKIKNDMVSQVRVGLHPEFIRVVMDLKVSDILHPVFSETEQGLRVEIGSGAKR